MEIAVWLCFNRAQYPFLKFLFSENLEDQKFLEKFLDINLVLALSNLKHQIIEESAYRLLKLLSSHDCLSEKHNEDKFILIYLVCLDPRNLSKEF